MIKEKRETIIGVCLLMFIVIGWFIIYIFTRI